MRRHHDMGGLPSGPIDRRQHDYAVWEKKVDAIMRLLTAKGVMTVDQLRRGIEDLGPGAYDELSYYERWISSISNILLEKGLFTPSELGEAMKSAIAAHAAAASGETSRAVSADG